MGSIIELNDTLQITTDQGFPETTLNLEKHQLSRIKLKDLSDKIFEFKNKPDARIFHLPPTRCFLVHNINGKWLYWGKILILEQTINADNKNNKKTSGKYKIIEIYDPEYQKQTTIHESPEGKSYFKI
jgi:hypothetical protein